MMPPKATRTCACGLAENSDRERPAPCQGCEVCETNYQGEPLEEHQPEVMFNQLTGEVDHFECSQCGEIIHNA